MSEEKKSRPRGPNFEREEKELLLDLAIQNKSIIEAKLTNKITKQRKDQVWGEASQCVNALGYASRHPKEYKTKWSNMLQRAKLLKSEQEISMRKTGGGPPLKPLSPCTERILQHFGGGVSFKGLTGVVSEYDDDEDDVTPNVTFVTQEQSSPQSCRLIEALVTGCDPVQGPIVTPTPSGSSCVNVGLSESVPSRTPSTSTGSKTTTTIPPRTTTSATTTGSAFIHPNASSGLRTTSALVPLRISATTTGPSFVPPSSSSGLRTLVPLRTTSTTTTTTTKGPSLVPTSKPKERKRKVTHDDISEAQYEALQLQMEKFKAQTKYYKLKTWRRNLMNPEWRTFDAKLKTQ